MKSLLTATGIGLTAMLITTSAKAYIVFAPAAFAAATIGAVLFGVLVGGVAATNHYWYYAPPPPAYGPAVYVSPTQSYGGCYPATVRIHHVLHHVQVCD
jgi:hypothetical protein